VYDVSPYRAPRSALVTSESTNASTEHISRSSMALGINFTRLDNRKWGVRMRMLSENLEREFTQLDSLGLRGMTPG